MRVAPKVCCGAAIGLLLAGSAAQAANAGFQDFFFDACVAPTGALASRCAETPDALGNLSGDSESSLNPSQNLSHNQPPVSVAQTRSKEARERGEKLRDDTEGDAVPVSGGDHGAEISAGPWSVLVNVHGTWFDRTSNGAVAPERGFEGDSAAAEIGVDYRLSNRLVIGAIAGIERTDYEFDAEAPGVNFTPARVAGDADSDNVYLTLFGSWALGSSGFLELSGGYEQGDGTYRRDSVFQESTRTLPQTESRVSGETEGTVTWFSLNAGFDVDRGAFSFGPYAGVTQTKSDIDSYTERDDSGTGLNMRFGSTSRDSLLGHAGARASYAFSTARGVLLPQVRAEYQHEFEDDPQTVVASYVLDADRNSYRMTGGSGDHDSINLGLSVAMVLANGWVPFADYAVLLENDGLDRQRATLGLRVEF